MKTCGDCRWLDPATVPTQASRRIRYCTKRCTWEYADTPRGEIESEFCCLFWTPLASAPENA